MIIWYIKRSTNLFSLDDLLASKGPNLTRTSACRSMWVSYNIFTSWSTCLEEPFFFLEVTIIVDPYFGCISPKIGPHSTWEEVAIKNDAFLNLLCYGWKSHIHRWFRSEGWGLCVGSLACVWHSQQHLHTRLCSTVASRLSTHPFKYALFSWKNKVQIMN